MLFILQTHQSKEGNKRITTKRKPDKLTRNILKEQKSIPTIVGEDYLLHKTLPQSRK